MDWIRTHFRKHQQREFWDYCWRTTLESLVIGISAAIGLDLIISQPERDFHSHSVGELFFLIVILAPVAETLFFQAIPISIVRQLRGRFRTQLLASVILFFLAHVIEGLGVGLAAGLVGGFYLAFTYATWIEKSTPGKAFLVTMTCHALGNALIFPFVLLSL